MKRIVKKTKVPNDLYQAGSHYLGALTILIYHLRTGKRDEGFSNLLQWLEGCRKDIEKIRPRLIINEDPMLEFVIRRADELVGILITVGLFSTLAEGLDWLNRNQFLLPRIISCLKPLGETYNFNPRVATAT